MTVFKDGNIFSAYLILAIKSLSTCVLPCFWRRSTGLVLNAQVPACPLASGAAAAAGAPAYAVNYKRRSWNMTKFAYKWAPELLPLPLRPSFFFLQLSCQAWLRPCTWYFCLWAGRPTQCCIQVRIFLTSDIPIFSWRWKYRQILFFKAFCEVRRKRVHFDFLSVTIQRINKPVYTFKRVLFIRINIEGTDF